MNQVSGMLKVAKKIYLEVGFFYIQKTSFSRVKRLYFKSFKSLTYYMRDQKISTSSLIKINIPFEV